MLGSLASRNVRPSPIPRVIQPSFTSKFQLGSGPKRDGGLLGSRPRFARLIDARSASGANGRPEIVTIGKFLSPSLVSVRPTSINALPNRFQFLFRQRLVDAFDPSRWPPQRPPRPQFRVPGGFLAPTIERSETPLLGSATPAFAACFADSAARRALQFASEIRLTEGNRCSTMWYHSE
jgi:hypothetical protein